MGATATVFCLYEEHVMEYSTDFKGLEAFDRFLKEFGTAHQDSYRKQLALMHYMEGFASFLIVLGMVLLFLDSATCTEGVSSNSNKVRGHVFGALGVGGFAFISRVIVDTLGSFHEIKGNEAMIENAGEGIMVFSVLAVANLLAALFLALHRSKKRAKAEKES